MGYDLQSCLDSIDPGSLDYSEWVQVGMALKAEGYECHVWDEWSRRDVPRYHPGECERKWQSFSNAGRYQNNVTGGTVVEMAKRNGWEPPEYDIGEPLDWDGYVVDNMPDNVSDSTRKPENRKPTYQIIDPTWVENAEIEEPDSSWQGWRDLVTYLDTLFSSEEVVGYVVDSWPKDGKFIPQGKGPHTETAGEIIARLEQYNGDLASAIGFNNTEAGAWIRFNPLDSEGVLTDAMPEGEQIAREQYREQGRQRKAERDKSRQAEKLAALREGMDACDRDGVERTLENVVERMPEVDGKQVSKGQVSNWIIPGKNEWCPIRSKGEKGKAGILFDPDLEAALEDW